MGEIEQERIHRYLPDSKGGYDEAGYKRDDGTWKPYERATYCQSLVDAAYVTNRWPKVTCSACWAHAPEHVRIGCKCCEPISNAT